MTNRNATLAQILRSPIRILAIVLVVVFTVEVGVMFVLPYVVPERLGEAGRALLDAILLTVLCAPILWWVIIGPLRRIAVQEHQRSETIVANAGEGIFTFDRDCQIVSCNRAGANLFATHAGQLVGQPIRHVIPDLPEEFDALPIEIRLDGVRQDGRRIPINVSVSEYPSEPQLMIAIVRDLTATQAAEQEKITIARQAEALRAQQMTTLAQLATGVAHEIRNPLTSIKMLIQVNRAKFAEQGLPTDDIELVEQEIRRMERSVNSLLDYARPEKSEFCTFIIQHVIRRTCQLIDGRCVAQNVHLQVSVPNQPMQVFGDAAQIQQLLLNLSLNALDAMPAGGDLGLTVSAGDDQVRIMITDSGEGIHDDVLHKLFSPFVTTKSKGIGLGLGICRRIAETHQGTLEGSNRDIGGAQFELLLPLARDEMSQPMAAI